MSNQRLLSKKDGLELLPKIKALFADDPDIEKIWFGQGSFAFKLKPLDRKPFMSRRGRFNGTKYLQASDERQKAISGYIRMSLRHNGFDHVIKTVLQ